MRRWLAALLLILFSLQLPFAAAAGYCGHEATAGDAHFGHHACAASAEAAGEAGPDDRSAGSGHADCGVCHLSCAKALSRPFAPDAGAAAAAPARAADDAYSSVPGRPLERPNWLRAA